MFCTNCGNQLADTAKFCNRCGQKIETVPSQTDGSSLIQSPGAVPFQPMPEQAKTVISIAIPFHLKTSIIKKEAYIALFDSRQTALLFIGNERYKQITAAGKPETGGYFKKVAGMMHAYMEFARAFEYKPIACAVNDYPGSVLIDNTQIKSIRIYQEYDSNNEMYSNDYTIDIQADSGKYKGTLERGFEPRSVSQQLRTIFGKSFKF